MILIWDIHIYHKFADTIITSIRNYIYSKPKQENVVFLWDFVYHFSYHRKSILDLFNLFIELFEQWKKIYILAWNHDWLGDSFVFAEWKSVFDIINLKNNENIKFITKPYFENIENQEILFLPNTIYDIYTKDQIQKELESIKDHILYQDIENLINSKNKWEHHSGQLNLFLAKNCKNKNMTIIHHHYVSQISLPNIKSKFNFKDVAIHPWFLSQENIKMISGHLHNSFVYWNYFCAGNIRHSSPNEIDNYKFFCCLDWNQISYSFIHINPYISIDYIWTKLQKNNILEKLEKIKIWQNQVLSSNQFWFLKSESDEVPDTKICNLIINTDTDYQNSENIIWDEVLSEISNFKFKKISKIKSEKQDIDMTNINLTESIEDRKILLKRYLEIKFSKDVDIYLDILQKMEILK